MEQRNPNGGGNAQASGSDTSGMMQGGAAVAGFPGNGATVAANQGVSPHMMSLMANPAFAAAAAASPLFPPAAMFSNPGAFMAVPPNPFAGGANGHANPMMANPLLMMNAAAAQSRQQGGMTPLAPNNAIPGFMGGGSFAGLMGAPNSGSDSGGRRPGDLNPVERAKQNRDRNREHARSTRLRKKAYVTKLKELVEGLHAERTEEVRQRRVAVQHLSETQTVRRAVVRSFLRFHAHYETEERKWSTILEDDCWLKQPVTPYRSFRRTEIEQECRMSRGLDAIICDAASQSVMIENIGSRSSRWMQLKREEFVALEGSKRKTKQMPNCIVRQDSRLQHAVSSLSSSSGSSNHNSSGEDSGGQQHHRATTKQNPPTQSSAVVREGDKGSAKEQDENFGDSDASRMDEDSNSNESKRITTDSSSGEDSARPSPRPTKKFKHDGSSQGSSSKKYNLPPNIAKNGGIPHNIQPVAVGNGTARLSMAPAIPLPPFSGIGKKTTVLPDQTTVRQSNEAGRITTQGPAIISADVETTSNNSANSKRPQIRGSYHMNEDDMILMDDVLMCPFVFRSQDAVLCGALAECTMPGMLRASFSTRNKIQSVEMVYDAMGFMQQLERASGKEGSAHIIPGSLEMVLSPNTTDAQIVTLAEPPFLIVNVNELWTRMTGFTQMEVEGREYLSLIEGDGTVPEAADRLGRPKHRFEEVANGRSACSTNIHYDKEGKDFIEFVCSYPLSNASDEVTHLLHVCKELPSLTSSTIYGGE